MSRGVTTRKGDCPKRNVKSAISLSSQSGFSLDCELNTIGGAVCVGMLLQERSIEMQHTPVATVAGRSCENNGKAKGFCRVIYVIYPTMARCLTPADIQQQKIHKDSSELYPTRHDIKRIVHDARSRRQYVFNFSVTQIFSVYYNCVNAQLFSLFVRYNAVSKEKPKRVQNF